MLPAGVVITANTIYTALVGLAHHPDVQKKMAEEMKRVLEDDRLPALEDMSDLPYCQAVMLEVYRFYAPDFLPGPRTTIRDCHFRDYFFPKGTMVSAICLI